MPFFLRAFAPRASVFRALVPCASVFRALVPCASVFRALVRRASALHAFVLTLVVVAGLLSVGCVTQEDAASRQYYIVLGAPDDPVIAAAALGSTLTDPRARASALIAIADRFIARRQRDNALLVLEDAVNELARSNELDNRYYYPVSERMTVYQPLPGSLARSALYLDLVERYQRIGELDQIDPLLHGALNELLRFPHGYAHHLLLMRYLNVSHLVSVTDDAARTKALEAVLVYHSPILYGDLLQFVISFYDQDRLANPNAQQAFQQYLQVFLLGYRDRRLADHDWVSLAVHYALHRQGLISTQDLERVRRTVSAAMPVPRLEEEGELAIVARGLARGDSETVLARYQEVNSPELRCALIFSDQPDPEILASGSIAPEIMRCIDTARPWDVRAARARAAAVAAIVRGADVRERYVLRALGGDPRQRPHALLDIAQAYRDIGQAEEARLHLDNFVARGEREIADYEAAARFAALYVDLYSQAQLLEAVREIQNPLIRIALLVQVDRRYGDSLDSGQQQIIRDIVDIQL